MYSPQNAGGLSPETLIEFQFLSAKLRAWVAVDHNEDGTHNLRPSGFDFVPIGSIQMWGTDTPPARWALLDGTARSRTTYAALFQLWGTTFGAGDGVNTFGFPDMRQRFPLGKAASGTGATLGSTGGMIDHYHSLSGVGLSGTTSANGGFSGNTSAGGGHSHGGSTGFDSGGDISVAVDASGPVAAIHNHVHSVSTDATGDHAHTMTVGDHTHTFSASGSGTTGAENPPYIVLNFIVLAGV